MFRLAACLPIFLMLGCTDQEPLAPAFAGDWASDRGSCGGPRITISKSGIAAAGMPVDGLVFTSAKVSGATAHLVMELSPAARLVAGPASTGRIRSDDDLRNVEILATLIASGRLISPSNVIFRDKTTRQLKAAHPDVLAIMALRRCGERQAKRNFSFADASQAGQ